MSHLRFVGIFPNGSKQYVTDTELISIYIRMLLVSQTVCQVTNLPSFLLFITCLLLIYLLRIMDLIQIMRVHSSKDYLLILPKSWVLFNVHQNAFCNNKINRNLDTDNIHIVYTLICTLVI